ncbi:hypothetical protein FJZ36_06725 [Candidatus Poribacteria bacterium]|nr:hypothetical protein [Candidatus Poribacteria bacterium]
MVYSPAYRQAELECRALSGRMRAFRGAVGQPYQHPDIEVRRAYHALEVELEGAIALLYRALDESQVRQRQNLSELRSQAWAEIERQLLRYDGVRVYGPVPYSLVVSSAAHLDAIASSLDVRYVSLTVVRKRETDHE